MRCSGGPPSRSIGNHSASNVIVEVASENVKIDIRQRRIRSAQRGAAALGIDGRTARFLEQFGKGESTLFRYDRGKERAKRNQRMVTILRFGEASKPVAVGNQLDL